MRRGSRRSFSGLAITVALHGVIFMAVKSAHSQPTRAADRGPRFRPGRDGQARKAARQVLAPEGPRGARRPPPPDAIKLADDPNAKPAPVEAPKIEDPKTSKEVRKALERARKLESLLPTDDPEEGALNGSKLGTSDRAIGDQYDAQVMGAITQNYSLPAGMTPEQIAQPPEIQFKVAADGTLAGAKLIKSSGNPLVDDACVSAAQQTRKVTPPPGGRARAYAVACRK